MEKVEIKVLNQNITFFCNDKEKALSLSSKIIGKLDKLKQLYGPNISDAKLLFLYILKFEEEFSDSLENKEEKEKLLIELTEYLERLADKLEYFS